MFKEKPRKSRPSLEGGDHPELDTSELCDDHQTKQFQTLIRQLQWLISLVHFDIAVHVMSLSMSRAQPRKGHLERTKRIVGYLLFLPDGAIRFRSGEPDFSSLRDQEYDWTRTVYSGACEQFSHDIPKPLGKHVQTTHYEDANLRHDLATGKAVTAALHFRNQTPIDAYTKGNLQLKLQHMDLNLLVQGQQLTRSLTFKQPCNILELTTETRVTCLGKTDQLIPALPSPTPASPKDTIWHPIIKSGKQLQLNTSHSIGNDGKSNPADILSKHWEFATVWPMLKPILFWRGETASELKGSDTILLTNPGAEPPRDARDSGSARSHSTDLETSSSD